MQAKSSVAAIIVALYTFLVNSVVAKYFGCQLAPTC